MYTIEFTQGLYTTNATQSLAGFAWIQLWTILELKYPYPCTILALYLMAFSRNQVIKLFVPWFYIKGYFQPLGPLCLHKQLQTTLGIHGLWRGQRPHHLIPWRKGFEIYFRKYNLELHLFKAFGIWNTELEFTQENPWLCLDAFYATRFSLTELVFNWCLNLGRNWLRITNLYFVKFCNVQGGTFDFVFRKGTTLSIFYNNW